MPDRRGQVDDVEKSGQSMSGDQIMPYFIDISGAHGYHQITGLAILQNKVCGG